MVNTKQHPSHAPRVEHAILTYRIEVESWRFIAYIFFWLMSLFAFIMTRTFVVSSLAAGPEQPGDTCGPFAERGPNSRLEKLGVVKPGEGFNFYNESHLADYFGFSNICTNWDYTPAREATAMVYPLFEYSLIIYIFLDFLDTKISYLRGEINEWFWIFSKVNVVLNLIFTSQFRMIFVNIAYEAVQQHTAGFLGLQIALILISVQNTLFIIDTKVSYKYLGGTVKKTRFSAILFLVGLLIISAFKLVATTYVVMNGVGAPWTLRKSGLFGWFVGEWVDRIWMLFNAIMPLFISRLRAKEDSPLVFQIKTEDEPIYIDERSEENTLLSFGGDSKASKYEAVKQEVSI